MSWLTAKRRVLAIRTTERRLTSVRSFARWARWDYSDLQEYRSPTPAPPMPHPIPEGMEGVRLLIATARDERQKVLIGLLGLAGLRVGESLKVRPSHINLRERTLIVRGKGDKERILPVTDELMDLLRGRWLDCHVDDGLLVDMSDRVARRTVTSLGRRANLQRAIASHDLRATFLTAVHDKTMNMRLVQELAGHSSIVTSQTYTLVRLNTMREAVQL